MIRRFRILVNPVSGGGSAPAAVARVVPLLQAGSGPGSRLLSPLAMVRRLPRVYAGTHVDLPDVTVLRGTEVHVAAEAPVAAYGDGERLGPLPRTASVAPAVLRVLV